MVKAITSLALVMLFGVIAGFALLKSGLPPTHDGEYHIIRFYEFDKVLRDGNFYPRWAPDLNYGLGVPLFNFVYPFPNYFASFLHLFNSSFIDAFKLNMFFATIMGGIFFYLWAKYFWDSWGGVVSAVFYLYSPYRFLDIYIRGSVGEVWALAFFPAFLWAVTKFIKEKNKKYGLLSSVFLALTIFSHNILALMFFIFAIIYILFLIFQQKEKKYLILNTLYFILIGLGISSIFWLPALVENKYVTGLQIYNIEENFPDFYQLLIPSWGTGFSTEDLGNQMSFQIGIANLFNVILSIIAFFFIKNNTVLVNDLKNQKSKIKDNIKNQKQSILFFVAGFFIVFFLMLKVSLPVWNMIPLMNYFQFPWRLLSLEVLITSFLAGSFIYFLRSSTKKFVLTSFMIFISVFLSISYAKPAYYHDRDDNHYLTRENFIYGTNSPGDFFNTIWASRANKLQKGKISKNKDIKILSESIKSTNYNFTILVNKNSNIHINTAYFPGWEVLVDSKKVHADYNKKGLITFDLPEGKHSIDVKFTNTKIRSISSIIAALSLFFLILFSRVNYVKIKR